MRQMPLPSANEVLRPSRRMLGAFSLYLQWYVGRAFHGVRVAHAERFPRLLPNTPAIVCLNHPSWWDPLICMLLSRAFAPLVDHYAPMEASALQRYGFMRRMGLFPLDTHSSRAGSQFLRAAREVLGRPNSILWVTPEGHFTDVRQRPAQWRPGLAALVGKQSQCTIIPLALEYTFWDERLPEALGLVGEPVHVHGQSASAGQWQAMLTQAMTQAQDELASLSLARDAALFTTILRGGSGIAAPYDAWKRLQARWRGRPYQAGHGSLPPA